MDAPVQWYSTSLKLSDLLDSSQYPPQWVISKGKRTKLASTQASPPGGGDLSKASTNEAEPRPELGRRVKIVETGRDIVLFRYGSRILAMDPACPHMKGDLACGDIESLGAAGGGGAGRQYSELKERETHELLQRKLEAVTLAQADLQSSGTSKRRASAAGVVHASAAAAAAAGTGGASTSNSTSFDATQLHNPAGEGLCITCPVHGWSFSCSTGVSSKPLYRLRVYPTKLRWVDGKELVGGGAGTPHGEERRDTSLSQAQGGAQVTVCYPEGEALEAYGSDANPCVPSDALPGQLAALAPPHIHAAAGRRASTGPTGDTPFVLTPPQVDTAAPVLVQRMSGPGRPPAAPRPASLQAGTSNSSSVCILEGTSLGRGAGPLTVAAAVAGSVRTPGPEGYAAATIDYESSGAAVRRASLGALSTTGLPAAVLANLHEQGAGQQGARMSAGMSPMAESSSLPRSVPLSVVGSLRVSPHGTPARPHQGAQAQAGLVGAASPMAGDKGSPLAHRLSNTMHATASGAAAASVFGLGSSGRRGSGLGPTCWGTGQEGTESVTPSSPQRGRIPPLSSALAEAASHPWAEAVIHVGLPQGLDSKLFNPDCADF